MEKIQVCFSTDDNYAKPLKAAMLSILDNKNDEDEYVFHILYSKLSDGVIEYLKKGADVVLHKVENEIFEPYFNNGVCKNVTIPTLYRLILPEILPDVDKILYLDCDILVNSSLKPLYDAISLEDDYLAAAVADLGCSAHQSRLGLENDENVFYFNAGVILFNLNRMRKEGTQDKLFDYLKQNFEHLLYSDQDVLNAVLKGRAKRMDKKFNMITMNFYYPNETGAVISHFAGVKPWKIGFYNPYRKRFWKYYLIAGANFTSYLKIKLFHARIMQILWFLKMYPAFFLKQNRRVDFMRIILNTKLL